MRSTGRSLATNIDGAHYKHINRKTGEVSEAEGSDVWVGDDRVDGKYYIDGTFYSATSYFFDKGHLTRREDPVWGDTATSQRANADTFHYTNCSPQHYFLNQRKTMWQGIEQFVLENGARAEKKKLCVFQGPLLNDTFVPIHDIKVPLWFWKVAVWVSKETGKLAASAFKISQQRLLTDNVRRGGPEPSMDRDTDYIATYRVDLASLAKETALDFSGLVAADRKSGSIGEGMVLVGALDKESIL